MATKKTAKKATTKQSKKAAKATKAAKGESAGKGSRAKGGSQTTKRTPGGGGKPAGTKRDTTGPTSKGAKASGKMSGLDAAALVLHEAGEPLSCREIVERAMEAGYWSTTGKTPAATIYSAILREIRNRGADSRFQKVDRGRFARNA